MNKVNIDTFYLIGITVRTTNSNGKAAADISDLWNRFWEESIIDKIPNKSGTDIYCAYTNFESDFTGAYTTLIGCKVSSLDIIPEGMTGITISSSVYNHFVARGNILEGAIKNEWIKIWTSDLNRLYKTDFEVYSERAKNPLDAEVDIYVGIK